MATKFVQRGSQAAAAKTGSHAGIGVDSDDNKLYVNPAGTRQAVFVAPIGDHAALNTDTDSKQVRINSRNFTQASGDSMSFQATPNQTVTTTGEVFGGQIKPRAAANVGVGGVNGLGVDVEMKNGAANNSGDLRGFNVYFGALGTGTITGDIVGMRLRLEAAKTVSGDIVAIEVEDNESSIDWTHFVKLNAALGTHGMTTASDKTGSAKSGTIKVKAGSTLYHIQLYAD